MFDALTAIVLLGELAAQEELNKQAEHGDYVR